MILDENHQNEEGTSLAVRLRENRDRYRIAKGGIIFAVGYSFIELLNNLYQLLSENFYYAPVSVLLDVISLLVVIIAAIMFIPWFRRAYYNLHQTNMFDLKYAEGWAAGGWFVPIISLFYPFRIMRDIYAGYCELSKDAQDHPGSDATDAIGWWWALWIISGVLSNIMARVSDGETESVASYTIYILIEVMSITSGLLLVSIMTRVSKMESVAYQKSI